MRANTVKRRLAAGGVALGTMVFEFSSTGIGRIIAAAGADFVLYDLEHTGWSIETIRMLLATTRAAEVIPMVRVPASDDHLLARPLDLGALGIMVPMVETAAQAQQIAAAVRYPPVGRRGAAFGVAHDDYAGGDLTAKMASANAELFLIAQIETAAGLANVEAIAATDGIDCLWIGHFDLTNALGIPGQFSHPTYLAAVARVLAACREHGKIPGIMVGEVDTGRTLLGQGFRAVAYSGDVWIYGQALRQGIEALRAAVADDRP
jgi:2-keto-3-deoxy-L-rhamnonate aldolase RhmA